MKKQFIIAAALAGAAAAQAVVYHGGDITTSEIWSASDVHNMTNRVTVLPGATLTIEPGTVIASDGGSLAICAGAQIFAEGTEDDPIIFTSVNDDFKTWRAACQEWGSLAIMGEGIISSHVYKGNVMNGSDIDTPAAVGTHTRVMEGLVARTDEYAGAENYGGDNDDYDAGTLSYVSFRYGGQVLEEASELNGLSLGGVGRETQIDHIEIMNNVDDGIEIWGGTVCMKYISIWNIGDDSLDCDQGWRGKVQHGLIVQGYSVDASQGSGFGDNLIEMDGSEDSDCEPHTTSTLYNFTVIGNPDSGDHGMALRDNVRLQVRNSIFMDVGDSAFLDEECDDDGGSGWDHEVGTSFIPTKKGVATYTERTFIKTIPNMEDTYGVAFNANAYSNDLVRIGAASNEIYWAQTDGYMNEITDTILYNVNKGGHIDEIELWGHAGYDVTYLSTGDSLPIVAYERGEKLSLSAGDVAPIISLNPCAANDALVADTLPTDDGFFDQVSYRGAFSADENWLAGWTAAYEYGMLAGANQEPSTEIDSGVYLTFDTVKGSFYSVESCENADFASNVVVEASFTGNGSEMFYGDDALESDTKFFRVTSF